MSFSTMSFSIVEHNLEAFLRAADDEGIVLVRGGPEVRLPPGQGVAFERELCGYPERTAAGISVRLTHAGVDARRNLKAKGVRHVEIL